MQNSWDVVVLGLGGVGSSAAFHLSRCGLRVLGIDQFGPAHDHGSSHGQTRIIRQAYFEHPDYVPLLRESYDLWQDLEAQSGQTLFHRTGLLQVGPRDGVVVPGVMRSAAIHGLQLETIDPSALRMRYPQFVIDDSWLGVFERNAGYLRVEACVLAHLDLAKCHGAVLRYGEKVLAWKAAGQGVELQTSNGVERAAKLIVAAGPWARDIFANHGMELRVLRKHMYWYTAEDRRFQEQSGMPCFFFETEHGYYYGFPAVDERGLKVARHSGGEVIETLVGNQHPKDPADRALVESFLNETFPDVALDLYQQAGCYYTMTNDENFIVDTVPGMPQVIVMAGLSGHGFKFTSALGKIACDMARNDSARKRIEFLGWR